jgi:hypothetical protein
MPIFLSSGSKKFKDEMNMLKYFDINLLIHLRYVNRILTIFNLENNFFLFIFDKIINTL